jgi:hypothetical protein
MVSAFLRKEGLLYMKYRKSGTSSFMYTVQYCMYGACSNFIHKVNTWFFYVHCPKFKAEFLTMERSVGKMKCIERKYSGGFIPYNLTELFQGCEELKKFTCARSCVLYHLE